MNAKLVHPISVHLLLGFRGAFREYYRERALCMHAMQRNPLLYRTPTCPCDRCCAIEAARDGFSATMSTTCMAAEALNLQ